MSNAVKFTEIERVLFFQSFRRKCVRKDSEKSSAPPFMCSIHVDVLEHLGKHNTFLTFMSKEEKTEELAKIDQKSKSFP